MQHRILVVDDETKIRTILGRILADEGYTVETAGDGTAALETVTTFTPDLVIMDQNMPGMDGIATMEQVLTIQPDTIVIMLTAHGSIDMAVTAMKAGAYDYLTKPFNNDELVLTVERAIQHTNLSSEVVRLRRQLSDKFSFDNIIGSSPAMQRLYEQMIRVCDTNATVLIAGQSGTGKELVARAIHYHSGRSSGPLISVNCGAIPENLIESEFFGHEKGAFTDAKKSRMGAFERAHGGTLFLDEIGELPLDAQVKLLRAIEQKQVTRVGGSAEISVDVRIISATNKDLQREVDNGAFRLDLLYRLNIFTLAVPALCEREGDISLLVEHFIAKYNTELGLSISGISRQAIDILSAYQWPGNVRDLENAVQSAMILRGSGTVEAGDLPMRIRGYPEEITSGDPETVGLDRYIGDMCAHEEKKIIRRALSRYNNNRTATAEALGISRKTLFNKIRQYGIGG